MSNVAMRRKALTAGHPGEPMMDLNTTPLIDVMLVLLVMMIITIPPKSHKVRQELPQPQPVRFPPLGLVNDVTLSATGSLAWNGESVSDSQFRVLLAASAEREVQPEIHFRPDAASRYERVDEVLAMASQSGVGRFGFVGNDRYSGNF